MNMSVSTMIKELHKIAAEKITDPKQLAAWELTLPLEKQRERQLIRAVKDHDGQFEMKELIRLFKGAISNAIRSSQLTNVMNDTMANQYAIMEFREMIKKDFDLSVKVIPITYVTGALADRLKKRKYEFMNTTIKKSEELERESQYTSMSRNFLMKELDRMPTIEEEHSFIKHQLGKNVSLNDVRKIREQEREEKSGDKQIGKDVGADFMTLMDLKNVAKHSPEEIMENEMLKSKVESMIRRNPQFTRAERRFLYARLGLGEYTGKNTANDNAAAIEAGMSYYEGRKTFEKLKEALANL